ncbi:MAG: DUF2071 domain-containing protein [Actinomycetota bacterium]|nr:DUF2071 domain-containing protein [Actinomycetota bacterium]
MAGQLPEETVRCPVVLQGWRHMTFVHWAYTPEVLQPFLPDGSRPHVVDGAAWVGLTPFLVVGARFPLAPPVPGLSTFPETNLRTYVLGSDGLDAIWFFTLEADSLATVLGARAAFGVPYRWADMAVDVGARITYRSTRRPPNPGPGHHIVVEPGEPLAHDEVPERDHYLTGRWRACASIAGRPAYVAVEHQPWPLHRATVHRLDEDLLADAGLPPPEDEPLVHYSPGVDARLGARARAAP